MKIHVLQENLSKALSQAGRIISSKAQLPVLQNFLFLTENGLLKIIATNLETTLQVSLGVKEDKSGSFCVPAKTITEFIQSLPQETVSIEQKEEACIISTSRAKATIPTVPAGEFPPVKLEGNKKGEGIKKIDWGKAVSSVLFAAATDEGRPLLTGIKIKKNGEETVFAATDGYRLSVKRVEISVLGLEEAVVPARALYEVQKISSENKDSDEIVVSRKENGQLAFVMGDVTLETRLIDGEYPDFQRIIPKTKTTEALFDREEMLRSVKTAAIFARDNANIIRLSITQNTITLSANTPQVGEDVIDVEAEVSGDDATIAFNSRFLIDYLSNTVSDRVLFEMMGSLNPGVFKTPNDDTLLHIIMPVRVQG